MQQGLPKVNWMAMHPTYSISQNHQKTAFFVNSYIFSSTKRLKMSQNGVPLFGGDKSRVLIPETAHEIFPIFSKMLTFDHKRMLISADYFRKYGYLSSSKTCRF